jgi:conjugative transfer region protein TrbK
MESKTFARIGAIAFVSIAITMTALQLREVPEPTETILVPLDEGGADPLASELKRCQSLGAGDSEDVTCRQVWAIQRQRFLHGRQNHDEEWRDDAGNPFPGGAGNAVSPDSLPLTDGAAATAAPSGGVH